MRNLVVEIAIRPRPRVARDAVKAPQPLRVQLELEAAERNPLQLRDGSAES